MKPTSFKEIETYLYTSVVLPLKGLNVEELRYPSPIYGRDGSRWEITLRLTPVRGNFRRNYQRELAESNRNFWLLLKIPEQNKTYIIGEYNVKSHWIKLYETAFKELDAQPLMGKMLDVFNCNTPFTKVITDHSDYPEYTGGGTVPRRSGNRLWEEALRVDVPEAVEAEPSLPQYSNYDIFDEEEADNEPDPME